MLEPSGTPRRPQAPPVPALASPTDHHPLLRVQAFLEAQRAVMQGRACLTEVGAAYLGMEFRFGLGAS